MKKFLGLVVALALGGCSATAMNQFNTGLVTTTQNLVALNNALVQINVTILNNVIAQAKLLAPYECGAYALAATIIQDSNAASAVNNYLSRNVAAGVANVAVRDICSALGYPTTVFKAPPSSVPAVVAGG